MLAGSDAEVFLSCRRPDFSRARAANRDRIAALIADRQVQALMNSEVRAITNAGVELKNGTHSMLPSDYVIACLGGELPTEFLKSVGVGIHRHHGVKAMANPALAGRPEAAREGRASGLVLFALGAAIIAGLAWAGRGYYLLPFTERVRSPLHAALRPSGVWGHGVGIAATLFMLLNFVYPIRKRLKIFKGRGSIAPWLRFHVFVGLMSPIVILFHSAFQWRNMVASLTYVSLVIVVLTGLVGRFLYGLVQVEGWKASLARMRAELAPTLARAALRHDPALDRVLDEASAPPDAGGSLVGRLLSAPWEVLRLSVGLGRARPLFLDASDYRQFRRRCVRVARMRIRVGLHRRLKRLLNAWRIFHVVLAVVLLGVIAVHVGVSLHLGFRWIFK